MAPPPELEPAHEPSLAPAALAGPPASAPTAGHVDSGAVPADAVIADGAGEEVREAVDACQMSYHALMLCKLLDCHHLSRGTCC